MSRLLLLLWCDIYQQLLLLCLHAQLDVLNLAEPLSKQWSAPLQVRCVPVALVAAAPSWSIVSHAGP